jgi:hypothetical protein
MDNFCPGRGVDGVWVGHGLVDKVKVSPAPDAVPVQSHQFAYQSVTHSLILSVISGTGAVSTRSPPNRATGRINNYSGGTGS